MRASNVMNSLLKLANNKQLSDLCTILDTRAAAIYCMHICDMMAQ